MRTRLLCGVVAAVAVTGCIVEAPGSGKAPEDRARGAAAAQPLVVRNGAKLGGKVEVAAVTVVPGRFLPGEALRVQVLFKVLEALEQDYVVFVHVEDADGRMERMNVDHQPVGGSRPTSSWKAGETLRDEFSIFLPPGRPLRAINVWMGLWEPKSDTRLTITNPAEVRHDGKDRLLIAQVPAAQ